jgi:tight adherence protein C
MGPVELISLSVFGGVSCLAWLVITSYRGQQAKLSDRLGELCSAPTAKRSDPAREKATAQLIEQAASRLARPLTPRDLASQQQLRRRLTGAGINSPRAVPIYLACKVVALLIGIGLGLFLLAAPWYPEGMSLLAPAAGGLLGLMLPDAVIWHWRRRRQEQIFLSLPDALDLLVLCVEVGHGLDSAIRRVAEEMADVASDLCAEFNLYNTHVNMGRPRQEALRELGLRSGVEDLNTLAAVLIQVDRFGSSIADTLREMSDSLRVKRRQLAEERAQKTSVQLVFPLVLFIFPGIIVVLVGPAAIMIMEDMLK